MSEKNELALPLDDFEIPDLNLPGIMELRSSVIDCEDMPDKACIVLALTAMGFSQTRIGKMLGITGQAVNGYINRYDPKRKCVISDDDRRAITTQMMQSTAIEALMNITSEKLQRTSAKGLADIAAKCAATMEKLKLSKNINDSITTSRVHSMLDALDVAEEAND